MEKVVNTQKPVAAKEDVAKTEEFKAKKREAAKKCADRKKERAAQLTEKAKALVALIEAKKVNLPAEDVEFWKGLANPTVTRAASGTSFLNKVFGDSPKVGDKITLMDFMKKTMQGKSQFDKQVKALAEKGIIIEYKAAANMLEATYTITKLA